MKPLWGFTSSSYSMSLPDSVMGWEVHTSELADRIIGQSDNEKCTKKKAKWRYKKQDELLIRWCTKFVCLGVLFVNSRRALIGSHSLISKSLFSSNYTLFLLCVLSGLAFLFLFWLGLASKHSVHKLITTSF